MVAKITGTTELNVLKVYENFTLTDLPESRFKHSNLWHHTLPAGLL